MANEVQIIIQATDKASSELDKVGNSLGGLAKIAAGVAAAGLAAVGAGLALCISEAMDAEKVQAQLNSVLKATGGIAGVTAEMANGLAESLSGVTTYSDDAILSGENMLLTFKNIGKDTFPAATAAMLDMSTAMGQDLKSSSIQLGKALNDPVAGISALARVGVTFTEEQKAMIQSMVDAGDIAGAQAVIINELNSEFGGAAQAAGQTFGGQLDILKNALLNVAEGIGTKLLPIFADFMQNNLLPMIPVIQALGDKFVAWLIPAISQLSTWFSTVLQPAMLSVWQWMSTVLMPFLTDVVFPWIATNLPIALQKLADFWTTILWPAIQNVWAWMSTVLIPFLTDVVFPWLQENIPAALQTLSDFWTGILWPAIQTVHAWIVGTLFPMLQTLWDWIATNLPPVIQTLTDYWQLTLLPAITAVWAFINDSLIPLFIALADFFNVAMTLAITALTGLWEKVLQPALSAVWSFISEKLQPVFQGLSDFFNNTLGPVIQGIVEGPVGNLQNAFSGISTAIQNVIDWIKEMTAALEDITLPDWLTPGSPTPFEMGLRGITAAMAQLNSTVLPQFSAELATVGAGGSAGDIAAGKTTNNYYNLSVNSTRPSSGIVADFGVMRSFNRA